MNTRALGLVMLLGCAIPLAACNPQQAVKKAAKLDRDRGDRGGRGGHGLKKACAADIAKFCSGDRGRERRQCLQTHVNELSADCKDAVNKRGGGRHRRRDF